MEPQRPNINLTKDLTSDLTLGSYPLDQFWRFSSRRTPLLEGKGRYNEMS